MYFDLNIKQDFEDIKELEKSEMKGFCMTFSFNSNLKMLSSPALPVCDKPVYSRIDIPFQNRLDQSTMSYLQIFNIICLSGVNNSNISTVIKLEPDLINIATDDLKHIKKSFINVLKDKGIYIELVLSDALYDSKKRIYWMNSLRRLIRLGCSKNLIISSGASIFTELKRPHDISKLLNIFGLSDDNVKKILLNSEAVLRKAAMKRYSFRSSVASSVDEGRFKSDFVLNYHRGF